ncbi:MAG: VWA domain-containing protein [Lewinellaceae bacterium]|nr:VWA domain-containing protein [Saprospiraceae bacterium]MCB9311786.1 VWA domain-containing protein [Lewinellaceae bacterium]HRW74659.1 hypothetical protein [Saprospiraceae bacterium]
MSWPFPWWYLLGCLVLGLLVSGILYYRSKELQEKQPWVRYLLAALRALVVTALAILLLSPLIRREESELQKPVLVIAQDASASLLQDPEARNIINRLDDLRSQLAGDFDVQTFSFGQRVREGFDTTFNDQETDLAAMLDYTHEVLGQENLGGIILATDGLYNSGQNPRYARNVSSIPIFSIGLGDPTPIRDLGIKRIFHNKIAYQGDQFQVQIDVQARNCKGERSELGVYEIREGKSVLLQKIPVQIDQDPFFHTMDLVLEAGRAGVHHYRFIADQLTDEKNRANNVRDVYIDVLDARQKVLILADAPHPDVTALRQSLSAEKNYDIQLRFGNEPVSGLREYDLIILHQIPSRGNQYAAVLQEVKRSRIPVWYILGQQSDIRTLPAWQGLLEINGDGRSQNEVQALVQPNFETFTLDTDAGKVLPQFPPLVAPFGDYLASPASRVLLYQRIGTVSTNFPLWLFGEENGVKVAILAGEGLWKWRLFDFLQHNNHLITDELIRKTVQFLSLKADKRRFRVLTPRQSFTENEPITFDGELYNDNYELVNDPDAQVRIRDEAGEEYPFTMNKEGKMYALQAGLFPPGQYTYEARTNYNNQELSFSGKFSVQEVQIEQIETQADHDLLKTLAEESGGAAVTVQQLDSLVGLIRQDQRIKPVLYSHVETKPAIHLRWIFGILLLLLAVEWLIRRYSGTY